MVAVFAGVMAHSGLILVGLYLRKTGRCRRVLKHAQQPRL